MSGVDQDGNYFVLSKQVKNTQKNQIALGEVEMAEYDEAIVIVPISSSK